MSTIYTFGKNKFSTVYIINLDIILEFKLVLTISQTEMSHTINLNKNRAYWEVFRAGPTRIAW